MSKLETFEEFLTGNSVEIPIFEVLLNLGLAIAMAFLLAKLYVKYGRSLSNRRSLANNFVIITATTMFVIVVVKSSLALSLGLVGALSIVRFRTALKEPEELGYMFFCIAIGLGLGAGQRFVTLAIYTVVAAIIILMGLFSRKSLNQNLHLTVQSSSPDKIDLKQITEILQRHCRSIDLKRFDANSDIVEASYLVEFDDYESLSAIKSSLQKLDGASKITFLDSVGVFY